MITITSRQVRSLRAVMNTRVMGPRRGHAPPLIFAADPRHGLHVRYQYGGLAVECLMPDLPPIAETLLLPPEGLYKIRERDRSAVTLEADPEGRTLLSWEGCPIARYRVPDAGSLPPFPLLPLGIFDAPADLLEVLARQSRGDSGPLRLVGRSGEVVDRHGWREGVAGGRLPWRGERLMPSSPAYGRIPAPRSRPLRCGLTEGGLAIWAWPWTLWVEFLPEPEADPEGAG